MLADKKRICFVNSVSSWGGGEKWHFETSVYLKNKGYDVYFVTAPNSVLEEKLKNRGIKVFSLTIKNFSWLNPFKKNILVKFFIENKIDTIIINSSPDVKIAGIAAKKANVPRVIYRRGSAIPIKNSPVNRYVFSKLLTGVLANSEATKRSINANNSNMFPAEKIKVIYNSVDTTPFLKDDFNPVYHKNNNEIIIGNLARLAPQKNQVFLIEVAKRLKAENISFKILIGGVGSLKHELETAIYNAGLQNDILLSGFQDNPKNFISTCDIFLLPSLWEGFGYALAEASLCRKPVIAFNVSSNPEVIINNKTGFLTEVNDADAVVEKIKLLAADPPLMKTLGNNGFEYCFNKFNAENVYSQLISYLSE